MLTYEENRWNFLMLKIISELNLLPIELEKMGRSEALSSISTIRGQGPGQSRRQSRIQSQIQSRTGRHFEVLTGRIRIQSDPRRLKMWRTMYLLEFIHWLYILGRLIQSLFTPEHFQQKHFVIHFILTILFFMCFAWAFLLFFEFPDTNVIIFNYLFTDCDHNKEEQIKMLDSHGRVRRDANEDLDDWQDKPPRRILDMKYSLHELLAVALPFVVFGSAFLAIVVLGVERNRMQFIYFSLPFHLQNRVTFSILFPLEIFMFLFTNPIAYFSLLVQILFLQKCDTEFSNLLGHLKTNDAQPRTLTNESITEMLKVVRRLKMLFVFIELCNRCFPFVIFFVKMMCLSISISGVFYAIRHIAQHPLIGSFCTCVAFDTILLFCIIYQNAFTIPGNFQLVKDRVLLNAKLTSQWMAPLRREIRTTIRAIPNTGIKVGGFQQLQRISTPDFINYITSNIANLLISSE